MEFIDLRTQQDRIRTSLEARIRKVLDHGQYILGPEIQELEAKLAEFCGVKHCVTVGNGTDALLVAFMALDLKPGDEIVTTPFSFIAAAEMALFLGVKPKFGDIEPRTYNLDPKGIASLVGPRTKALVPVNLFGQCADYDAFHQAAAKLGIPVIEDAAQSFGAMYKKKRSGSLGKIACTSFFPAKTLGCYGDGGACFTDDDGLAQALRELRHHGQERRYYHTRLGLNARFDTLQAAILLAKLEVFEDELGRRQEASERYATLFKTKGLAVQPHYVESHNFCSWAQYTVRVPQRDAVQKSLTAAGVPTAVHYPMAIHEQPIVREKLGAHAGALPETDKASREVMSLPMHPYLDAPTQEKVVDALARALSSL